MIDSADPVLRADRAGVEIPLRWVGPVRLRGPILDEEVRVPLATFESPLWPSVARGARLSCQTSGISVTVCDERMSRSVVVEAPSALEAIRVENELRELRPDLAAQVEQGSRFTRFSDIWSQVVGNLLYLRLEVTTGDASGHNMATIAAERMLTWLLERNPSFKYVSISANVCTDKKVSAINGILGRGRYTVAEITVPTPLCLDLLRVKPRELVDLHIKKNLIGSILAGGVRTANAQVANVLLAFFLATGQDAANIVEGSQAIVHAEAREDALYFSVTLPHLIVGTVGNGKDLPWIQKNVERLGCCEERSPGENARRLVAILGGAVLCGEISLLAAQANPGELSRAHMLLERRERR